MRILVVDDDPAVRRLVRAACDTEGHDVDEVATGAEALAAIDTVVPDLIVLDVGLPDISGFDVCRAIRARSSDLPVIFLSGQHDEVDVVVGLEIGANDYIQKPFRPRELLARIRATGRRPSPADRAAVPEQLDFAGFSVLFEERRLLNDGVDVPLTHTEFELIACLARHVGRAVARDQILREVWGYEHHLETRMIDVHIRNLRRKLEATPSQPRLLLSVPGVGYRLAAARP